MNRILLILLLITCRCWGDGYICRTNNTTVIGAGGGAGASTDGYIAISNNTTVFFNAGGGANYLTVTNGTTVIGSSTGVLITNTTAGLVNWWKLDENTGTTTADSSDSATGTLSGSPAPAWVTGQINSALAFKSTVGNYVQLSQNTGYGNHAFTFSSWLKLTNNTGSGFIIYDSDNDGSKGFWIETDGGDGGTFKLNVVGPVADMFRNSSAAIFVNTWVHLVITWDGTITDATTVHVYTNAVETAYGSSHNGSGTPASNTTTDRFLGNTHNQGGAFDGIIDDPRIWNRVLTAGEITNMYQWRGQP